MQPKRSFPWNLKGSDDGVKHSELLGLCNSKYKKTRSFGNWIKKTRRFGNWICLRDVVFSSYLEFRTMGEVHKSSNSECRLSISRVRWIHSIPSYGINTHFTLPLFIGSLSSVLHVLPLLTIYTHFFSPQFLLYVLSFSSCLVWSKYIRRIRITKFLIPEFSLISCCQGNGV
jgi:hypothetical protein